MRFTDPRSAGVALSSRLEAYREREDALVLALARGGVAVGLEVSKRLGLPLDLLLMQRLLVPHGPDSPLCAVSMGGALFVDEELKARAEAPTEQAFKHFLADALAEFARTERACRGERPPVALARKTVLLVDNGIRTGSTVRIAVRALRLRSPARIVVATPVAAREACAGVEAVADELIRLATPEPFGHVGLWYADFQRPTDEEIHEMLEEAGRKLKRAS